MQRRVIDFIETFVPLAQFQSIRSLIAIAAYYGLKLEQINIGHCTVHPVVVEDMYIQVPQGLEVPDELKKEAPALRLLKALETVKNRFFGY
jgi:hypothetical protein